MRSWFFLFSRNLMWALQFTCIKLVRDQVGPCSMTWVIGSPLRARSGTWILTGIPAHETVMRDLLPDLACDKQVPALMTKGQNRGLGACRMRGVSATTNLRKPEDGKSFF